MKIKFLANAAIVFPIFLTPQILFAADTDKPIANTEKKLERYSLQRSGDTFVRLNNETGEITSCELISKNLICRLAADERNAYEEELSNLQSEVKRLQALEKKAGDNSRGDETARNDKLDDGLERFDQEMEEVITYSGKVVKRFFEVMKDLRKDYEAY